MEYKHATLGAGCFWGVEETFRKLPGVTETEVGYMGGTTQSPTYEQVCTGDTDHAEVVHITFDPKQIDFSELLQVFWQSHDPTTLNRQGPDHGTQYRSVIFYHSEEQKEEAIRQKEEQNQSNRFADPIVTQIVPATTFYRAEEYHQRYLQKRGIHSCGI